MGFNIKETEKMIIKRLTSGFLVALPLIILFLLFSFLFNLIVNLIKPFSEILDHTLPIASWLINFIAFTILVLCFLFLGFFIANKRGQAIFTQIEKAIFTPIPLYKTVQNIIKQFKGVGEKPFEKVVLVDMYGSGVYMTGFVIEQLQNDCVSVYVPTAPNPTNGFVVHLKESELIEIDTTTDKAMATVIGMGAGGSKILDGAEFQIEAKIK